MKSIKYIATSVLAFLIAWSAVAFGQDRRDVILKAMKDELNRNMRSLVLGDLQKPFYIGYTIRDARLMVINASLGALVNSNESTDLDQNVRVLVGDYKHNNSNFRGQRGFESSSLSSFATLPVESDYFSIRRALWIATDNAYKNAAESFEQKMAVIAQQKISEQEAALDDFSKVPASVLSLPQRKLEFKRSDWEDRAKELSSLFKKYPDIYTSDVVFRLYQADMFFTNSEGTETVCPVTLVAFEIRASTQADDGTTIGNSLDYYGVTADDLPSMNTLKKDVESMASNLVAVRTAPVMDDSYTGPVLFEGQAVAEMFAQRFFSSKGLVSSRKQLYAGMNIGMSSGRSEEQKLENSIDTRILPKEFSISALPYMKKFGSTALIGSFEIDAEGVKPPQELVLVDKGILKTLLNNRVPTLKVKASNGHERQLIGTFDLSTSKGPGVIVVNTTNGKSSSEIKMDLLARAKEEGLSYAIIVRKLGTKGSDFTSISLPIMSSGNNEQSNPVAIYKVNVADGKETLLRSAVLGDISLGCLRRIAAADKEQFVYNTLTAPIGDDGVTTYVMSSAGISLLNSFNGSIPASFVVPKSILFEELEVKKNVSDYTPMLPVVPSPLSAK